jgi:hypothetical protein
MSEEETVKLYLYLSSRFQDLDPQLKELLHRLEGEMFDVMTIAQIEAVQRQVAGEL